MARKDSSSLIRRGGSQHAFTLIELLVVVAIISILSAIAVPNFLEAQTRAKTARIKNDQRVLATGLETYRIDNNAYPYREPFPAANVAAQKSMGEVSTRMRDIAGSSLRFGLTTPISYLSSVPRDVFETRIAPPNNVIEYWDRFILEDLVKTAAGVWPTGTYHSAQYALISVGPDGTIGNTSANQGHLPLPEFALRNKYQITYDPTNGTISIGNINRIQTDQLAEEIFR